MKRLFALWKLATKLAAWEIQRWEHSRIVRCMDCEPTGAPLRPGRLRTPIAHQFAEAHHATTGHLVTVRRG